MKEESLFDKILPPIEAAKLLQKPGVDDRPDAKMGEKKAQAKLEALAAIDKKRKEDIPPLLMMKTESRKRRNKAEDQLEQELSFLTEDSEYALEQAERLAHRVKF
jgi:hypothetical protein